MPRVTLALVLFAAASARAQGEESAFEPVRLVVSRGEGAESCPAEDVLARSIATRLGYDPFRFDASRRVEVHVERAESGTQATVRLFGSDGGLQGSRTLSSELGNDCQEMAREIELSVSIAIDPLGRGRRMAIPSSSPHTPEPPPRARVTAALSFVLGTGPYPTGAISIGAGAEWRALSADLEARLETPSDASTPVGSFQTWLISFAVVPCGHWDVFAACPIVRGGPLRTSGHGVSDPTDTTSAWLALGARVAMEVPLDAHVRLGGTLELDAMLAQTNVLIGTTTVYTTERVAGAASFALWVVP